MNRQRRKKLHEASDLLEKAQGIIECVKESEQDAYDNLPENFQYGEKGAKMEETIDLLDELYDQCDELLSSIDELCEP